MFLVNNYSYHFAFAYVTQYQRGSRNPSRSTCLFS